MTSFEYSNKIIALLEEVAAKNEEEIRKCARMFADTVKNNHIIHTFGTGHSHMIGIEMFARAGGLANVNAMLDPDCLTSNGAQRSGAMEKVSGVADVIYDSYTVTKGDIMIITSNSGRNAMPIEMAMRCQKEGIPVIALTNLNQSKNTTSRHASGKRLFECADVILDNCVPSGDSMMTIGGVKTGPGSTMTSVFLLDTILCEALQLLADEGCELPVFQSQNVDGFNNDALYEKYGDRVKHF